MDINHVKMVEYTFALGIKLQLTPHHKDCTTYESALFEYKCNKNTNASYLTFQSVLCCTVMLIKNLNQRINSNITGRRGSHNSDEF